MELVCFPLPCWLLYRRLYGEFACFCGIFLFLIWPNCLIQNDAYLLTTFGIALIFSTILPGITADRLYLHKIERTYRSCSDTNGLAYGGTA